MVKLVLKNLNCPNCAEKIEKAVAKLPYVKAVEFNFINKQMNIAADVSEDEILRAVKNIADSIEEGVDTKLYTDAKSEPNENSFVKGAVVRFILGGILFGLGLAVNSGLDIILFLSAYMIFGYDVILRAFKNILNGRIFDENFLMSIATIAAFIIGEYNEAVAVMAFYQIGEFLQDLAVDRSKRSIKALMSLNIDKVSVVENGAIVTKTPKEIAIGDIIIVKAGEKIPVDGIITEGATTFDMQALTGESVPVLKNVGDEALSGSVNNENVIKIKAEKLYENSTVAKILDMVENAAGKKSKTENFISKFAAIYTPVVVISALLLALAPILLGYDASTWIYRALVFLVSSCPCALVVSVPLTFFSGIGALSKKGVLVKGGNYLQQLSELEAIAMDKTGTLTMGKFKVTNAVGKETLKYAASLECYSNHPIARAIVDEYGGELFEPKDLKEEAGYGVTARINGAMAAAGNKRLMDKICVNVENNDCNVFVAVNNKVIGYINVEDKIKESSVKAIADIKALGIKNITMLTGDRADIAHRVADEAGIDNVYSELLPQDKVNIFERLCDKYAVVAAVGDGINDAPLIAGADVGIAMGGIGSDAAIEAADVVIMDDSLDKIPMAVRLSRYTIKVCRQNIAFVVAVKVIVLCLAAAGMANMWMAVFADVGTALLAVLNSIKIIRK